MRTEVRSNAASAIIVALMVLGMPLLVYVVGYYGLAKSEPVERWLIVTDAPIPFDENGDGQVALYRVYPHARLATAYRPMAALEGWWRGIWVQTVGPDRIGVDFEFDIEDV